MVASLEATLEALGGRVLPEHAALVAAARGLAAACEVDPGKAALWAEYRGAIRDLMEATADGGVDELEALFAELDARAGVVDGEDRTA